jgi:polyisoprenoid-binding protein YceI
MDPAHSSIQFEVKHMMIATVHGRFKEFEGIDEVKTLLDVSAVKAS